MSEPTFSVIIPLYNKAAYVVEAVRSACEQSFPPREVIVINDGSTDGGADLVRALPYEILRVIDIANSGVSVARNTGIEAAHGDYVAFLDADDWWSPHFLLAIRRLIESFASCSIYATASAALKIGEKLPQFDTRVVCAASISRVDNYYRERAKRELMCMSSMAVPRALFENPKLRFAIGEAHAEDHDLWFRLVERAPLAFLDLPLAAYRRGVANSLTEVFAWDRLEPAYVRLWERTHGVAYPKHLRGPARQLVHRQQTSFARNRLVRLEDRFGALHLLLLANYRPGASLYWWSTLVACLMPVKLRQLVLSHDRGWKDQRWIARLLRRAPRTPDGV